MARFVISRLIIIWSILTLMISSLLFIAPNVPSQGTLLLTNDLMLARWERFQLYDVARQIEYGFTPDTPESAIFISLAPRVRRMALLNIDANRANLSINDYQGRELVSAIPMTSVQDFSEASWAAKGPYFLYYDSISRRDSSIMILDTQSGEIQEIPTLETERSSATWSPDNREIAFTNRTDSNAISQIWIVGREGQQARQLTHNQGVSYCPAWSPDGEQIAYLEAFGSADKVRLIRRDGTDIGTNFADNYFMTVCPQWSHDGKSLFFIGLNRESMQAAVFMMDIETGDTQAILDVNQTASLQIWR